MDDADAAAAARAAAPRCRRRSRRRRRSARTAPRGRPRSDSRIVSTLPRWPTSALKTGTDHRQQEIVRRRSSLRESAANVTPSRRTFRTRASRRRRRGRSGDDTERRRRRRTRVTGERTPFAHRRPSRRSSAQRAQADPHGDAPSAWNVAGRSGDRPPRSRLPPATWAPLEVFACRAGALARGRRGVPGGHERRPGRDSPRHPTLIDDLGFGTDIGALGQPLVHRDRAQQVRRLRAGRSVLPLYPGLLALVGRAFGGHYVPAGSCSLSRPRPRRSCSSTVWPYACRGRDSISRVLFVALLPDDVLPLRSTARRVLLLVVGAFALADGRRRRRGGVAGLALLTRPMGVALLPALALYAWWAPDRRRPLPALAIPPGSFALYLARPAHPDRRCVALPARRGRVGPRRSSARPTRWALPGRPGSVGRRAPVAAGVGDALVLGRGERRPSSGHEPRALRHAGALRGARHRRLAKARRTLRALRRDVAPHPLEHAHAGVPAPVPFALCLILFPCFVALALLTDTKRKLALVAGTSALLLGVHLTQWTLWQWVA